MKYRLPMYAGESKAPHIGEEYLADHYAGCAKRPAPRLPW
jgi:hypothetical protein